MAQIQIVWGTGSGPTELAAYDAALADANVHDYNLVKISSVIPREATVEEVGTAPNLGSVGDALFVVESKAGTSMGWRISAGLGWVSHENEPGIIYEHSGQGKRTDVRTHLVDGLTDAVKYRDIDASDPTFKIVSTEPDPYEHTVVVVLAVYGRGRSIFDSDRESIPR